MPIEFITEAQRKGYHQVAQWLRASLGDAIAPMADEPFFVWDLDTVTVFIGVHPWSQEDAMIAVRAYLADDEGATDP
ncbi:MAG: hypothetical protein V1772_04715, partial [Chloroflexota bacterium]